MPRFRYLFVALAFVAGAALGALFSPLRYQIMSPAGLPVIVRCDRLTGRVDVARPLGDAWHPVGKAVEDLTDRELQAAVKR